ncbi:MAG: MoxR family ATPase [Defluviitaleaceae bacterium]|nr:MoxR family ATPase [Defluviitaleaceae bacterium]
MLHIDISDLYSRIHANVSKVVVGRGESVFFLLAALFSNGHVLLEDVPGSGKTLLAKSVAYSVNCAFNRIQFTPDLLPSDITGINFFNMKISEFEFLQGPVFANIVLADEINRATPKTQSGLLECMEERQVTTDGVTRQLPTPFMVIATQNPIDMQGVFPLPEAQLDRFLFKVPAVALSSAETAQMLATHRLSGAFESLQPVAASEEIFEAQKLVPKVFVHNDLMEYIVSITEKTRDHDGVMLGVSARGALMLMRAAQSAAVISGRDYVIPDDIKRVCVPALAHRLILKSAERVKRNAAEDIVRGITEETPAPTEFMP